MHFLALFLALLAVSSRAARIVKPASTIEGSPAESARVILDEDGVMRVSSDEREWTYLGFLPKVTH